MSARLLGGIKGGTALLEITQLRIRERRYCQITMETTAKSLMKLVRSGTRLKLRAESLTHVKTREWIFHRIEEEGGLLLMHESGLYGMEVGFDDIDWEHEPRQQGRDDQMSQQVP